MKKVSPLTTVLVAFTVAMAMLTLLVPTVSAQAPVSDRGKIAGRVIDSESGQPLAYANVMVQGTVLGTFSRSDGGFVVENVPPGTHTVTVSMMGYKTKNMPNIEVSPLRTTEIEINLEATVVMEVEEIEVVAAKPVVDVESSATEHTFDTEEARVRVVNTVEDALATQAGVVQVGGQLFVRGGRSDEVKYYIDGLPVTDPLVGANSMDVSLASLESVDLLSGGFDAEYGNAQSGVVNLVTKEGTERFSGLVKYMTDDYGAPDKTYFNYDDLRVGLGGPTPIGGLTYFVSGQGTFTDTYLKTQEVRPVREWLGLQFHERQRNHYSGQAKLTYKFHGTMKMVGEALFSRTMFDVYNHRYSRVGYWSPTAGPGGEGEWWFEPRDSTFTYYNGPEHTPNRITDNRQGHLRFTHTLSDATFYTATFGAYRFFTSSIVKDKDPVDYDYTTSSQQDLDPLNLFYYIRGDSPTWRKQYSRTYTFKSDLTSERGTAHRMKTGVQADYYDMEMDERNYPSPDSPLGLFPDRYQVGAWGASWYVQDRMKYKGMIVNAGLRLDLFDPSERALNRANRRRALLGLGPRSTALLDRLIYQLSPRLGMAYPISDRDVLHFHYGRFQEVPRFENLYRHTGADVDVDPGTIVGNPFLDAKTTISYEVGVEHQFWGTSTINVTFFYRDFFGLIGTDVEESGAYDPRNPPGVTYVNLDYGTAQGLEFSLRKRMSGASRWAASLTYTYSRSKGSSSSETQGWNVATGGQDRAPITELALEWDRPHVISGNLYFQDPGVWGVNIEAAHSSGSPYTPLGIYDKEIAVEKINTGRLPSTFQVDVKADKRYKIYGQEFSLFLEGRNITDRNNVWVLNPAGSIYYNAFFTEYGQLGGAYNLRDVRQDLDQDVLIPLNDPRVYDEPRSFRVGIQFDW